MAVAGFNQLTLRAACNKNLAASAKHKCNGSDLKCSKNGGDIVGIGVGGGILTILVLAVVLVMMRGVEVMVLAFVVMMGEGST